MSTSIDKMSVSKRRILKAARDDKIHPIESSIRHKVSYAKVMDWYDNDPDFKAAWDEYVPDSRMHDEYVRGYRLEVIRRIPKKSKTLTELFRKRAVEMGFLDKVLDLMRRCDPLNDDPEERKHHWDIYKTLINKALPLIVEKAPVSPNEDEAKDLEGKTPEEIRFAAIKMAHEILDLYNNADAVEATIEENTAALIEMREKERGAS